MRPAAAPPPDADRFEIRADARPPRRGGRHRLGARTVLEPQRGRPGAVICLRTAIASTVIIGALVALARQEARVPTGVSLAAPTPALSAPQPAWAPVTELAPVYSLDGAPFAVRLHPRDGREDAVAVGALDEDGPHLRLVLRRGPAPPPSSFFVDLVRRAGEVGLSIARSGRAEAVPTKFGPVEAAEAVLVGVVERACLAFRFESREIGWSAAGWLCGPAGRPATGERLACLLERLTLAPAADDPALSALFAQGQGLRPAACEPPRPVAEHPAPERIPAELFLDGPPAEPAVHPPKPGPSRRRERS